MLATKIRRRSSVLYHGICYDEEYGLKGASHTASAVSSDRETCLSELDSRGEDLLHGQLSASEPLNCVNPTGGCAGH